MPILTIDSARLNGTPSAGTVRIKASRSPLMDSGSNTVYSGTQTFPLDAQGKLSVTLPATDSPSLGAPFTYTVEANLASGQWIYRGVKLPANVATIDITDAQSASHQVYPTRQEWDAIMAGMNTAIEGKVGGPGLTLRRDTTVGTRVLLDHPGGSIMLYGDTGLRMIPARNPEQATGDVLLHRSGDTVTIACANLTPANSETFYVLLANLLSFIPANEGTGTGVAPIMHMGKTVGQFEYAGYGQFRVRWSTLPSGPAQFSSTFTTRAPWPAALPGTPA